MLIPRILHQIWVGPEPFPAEFNAYTKTWRQHHPSWELRLWTEENFPGNLRRAEAYERLRVPAERSDILRLELLFRHGGVYVDTDFECLRALDPLIEDVDFFTAYLKPNRVNNAIIGSVPEHPILDRALSELEPREFHGYDKAAAGPLFFDKLMKSYPDVTIFPPELFYPNDPAQRREAFAVHHVARSWKDGAGFRRAAVLAEERLEASRLELDRTRAELERTKMRLALAKGEEAGLAIRLRLLVALAKKELYEARLLTVLARQRARRVLKRARSVPRAARKKLAGAMGGKHV